MLDNSTSDSTPKPSHTEHTLSRSGREVGYRASADWLILQEQEKPIAELFHVAYIVQTEAATPRPLTFVFNGGPGAASAYLHMGALGPRRVAFAEQGKLPKPPVRVVDNTETWLAFTDLVFIDPVGTGFSRSLAKNGSSSSTSPNSGSKSGEAEQPKETEFWEVERDLKALAEFIQKFLSQHHRWLSPIFIAGESYGGFRVARLARKLQQDFGVGLSGAILISPALEFSLLDGASDYNLTSWITALPSFAAAAAFHGRATWTTASTDWQAHLENVEQFGRKTLIPFLAMGDTSSADEQQVVYNQLASLIGLSPDLVHRHTGRIGIELFARELLRDQQRIVGLYDASITAIDPFPDRLHYEGTDPTLDGLDRLFTGAINSHLRETLKVETDRSYHLLNLETFKAWKFDLKGELKQGFIGAVDDLRVGMSLNPYMQVYVTHGIFDLVTPYFASNYLANRMRLDSEIAANLTLKHYQGGHMFYTWDDSRQQWFQEMQAFYQKAIA